MRVGSADGFSNANFVGTFRDRNQHKVHDTNTANEKGDGSNNTEHDGDDIEEIAGWMGNI